MKLHLPSLPFQIGYAILNIIFSFLIAALISQKGINIYNIQWIATSIVIAIFIFKNNPATSFSHSIGQSVLKILLFQLALYAIFYGISPLFGRSTFSHAILNCSWQLGLFPWGYMILMAISLRLACQHLNANCSVIEFLSVIRPITPGSNLWSLLFTLTRQSGLLMISVTFAVLFFNIYAAIAGTLITFSSTALISSLIALVIGFAKPIKQAYQTYLFKSKQWLFLVIPIFFIVISLLFGGLGLLLAKLNHPPASTPAVMTLINDTFSLNQLALLFSYGWWLGWVILGGVFIAHYSRSLSLRRMILTSSILPIVIALVDRATFMHHVFETHNWSIIIGIAGIVLLLNLLFKKDMMPSFVLSTLSLNEIPKQRAYQLHLGKMIKTFFVMVFFSFPFGKQLLGFFALLISSPLLQLSPFILVAIVVLILKRRRPSVP